jgi:serine/threonine-protein kinase Stk1
MQGGDLLMGRYRIERILGAGGVGRVYQARDLLSEHLGDPDPYVAIKMLCDEHAQALDATVLLHREFTLTRHLHHRNVVRVERFDIDHAHRRAFFTMQPMRGLTLKQLQYERPEGLPWIELRDIAIQLLDALSYAHDSGILHGDLKPGNIMLTDHGLRLFDFGMGQAVEGVLEGLPNLCRGRDVAWTTAYAAPELLESGVLTPAADVYAVACVIYEMACGTHPFLRLDAMRARAERLDRGLRMPRSLPSACRSVLRSALALDAHERQVNARDLYQAFARTSPGSRRWFG